MKSPSDMTKFLTKTTKIHKNLLKQSVQSYKQNCKQNLMKMSEYSAPIVVLHFCFAMKKQGGRSNLLSFSSDVLDESSVPPTTVSGKFLDALASTLKESHACRR